MSRLSNEWLDLLPGHEPVLRPAPGVTFDCHPWMGIHLGTLVMYGIEYPDPTDEDGTGRTITIPYRIHLFHIHVVRWLVAVRCHPIPLADGSVVNSYDDDVFLTGDLEINLADAERFCPSEHPDAAAILDGYRQASPAPARTWAGLIPMDTIRGFTFLTDGRTVRHQSREVHFAHGVSFRILRAMAPYFSDGELALEQLVVEVGATRRESSRGKSGRSKWLLQWAGVALPRFNEDFGQFGLSYSLTPDSSRATARWVRGRRRARGR